MFKSLRKNQGQSIIVQYVLTFFMVVAVITVMSVYVQRALQARIRGARNYAVISVNRAASDSRVVNLVGNPRYAEYEPYYVNQLATKAATITETRYNKPSLPSGTSGIFQLDQNQQVGVQSSSNQAPPTKAN